MQFPNQYLQPYLNLPSSEAFSSPSIINPLDVKNPSVLQLKNILQQKIAKNTLNKKPSSLIPEPLSTSSIYPITKQKIFTPPAKSFFILNSLYQSFKKKNQFKLLQQKVHKIEVYNIKDQIQQEAKIDDYQVRSLEKTHKIRVSPHIMFSSYESELSGAQIIKFIGMQEYIKPGVKNQLLNQILKAIAKLTQIKQIMKCYQKIFSTKYCSQNNELKELIEEKMIKKILSIDFNPNDAALNFNEIGKSLLGFPSISQNILYFIGLLFDKVQGNLVNYDFLYKIMRNNLSFKVQNLNQALQNQKNRKQIEALIKVNNKENNDLIKSLLRAYTKSKQKNPDLEEGKLINIHKIAQTEAKYKMIKIASSYENAPQTVQTPLNQDQKTEKEDQFTEKTSYTLKFISQVIKSGSNLWHEINQWLRTAKSQKAKAFLVNQISTYLQKCFNDQKKFKNVLIPHLKMFYKDMDQNTQIYRLWLKLFLRPSQKGCQKVLASKQLNTGVSMRQKYSKLSIIKKFVMKGITSSQNLGIFVQDIFSISISHVDILLDLFSLEKEKVFPFYKEVIENQIYCKHLFSFLISLREKNPVKFKQWFLLVDQVKGGELFLCSRYTLIQFMKNNMKIQIAFNWIRDLGLKPPSKFLVWNLISLIGTLKTKKEYPALRNCITRTLNLILIRTPENKLCDEFKKHLPTLAHQFNELKSDYEIIFADVSKETLNELKKAHMQSQTFKF